MSKKICLMNDGGTERFVGFYDFNGSKCTPINWSDGQTGQPIQTKTGQTPEDALFDNLCQNNHSQKTPADFSLVDWENDYGEYFPRMYRPFFVGRRNTMQSPDHSDIIVERPHDRVNGFPYRPLPIDESAHARAINQLGSLKSALIAIFRVVEPELQTMDTFGHEIRNLMLLASTEVESQWKAVLNANNYARVGVSTNDYIELLGPLRLAEYEVRLPLYPDCPASAPFRGWDDAAPTQSLSWYDAYNQVKHDRENRFQEAKLQHAIDATLAAAIMNVAQFGLRAAWREEVGAFFQFINVPTWEFRELYNYGRNSCFSPKNFSF